MSRRPALKNFHHTCTSPVLLFSCTSALFFTPSAVEGCARGLSPLLSVDYALFCAMEPSQPLSHQSLAHSFPCNGGGRGSSMNSAADDSPRFLLQICPFIISNLQDAPPATLFFSCFCIVAGGWVGGTEFRFSHFEFRVPALRQAARHYFPALVGGAGVASRIRTGKRGKAKVPETSSMMLTWQR
jgi:hypothetical protein